MAHSAMHFGIGLTSGALAGLPLIYKALRRRRIPTSNAARQWLIISYSAAIVAVFPSLLDNIGIPENITSAWPMNIFLLHPLISVKQGGKLIGETLIVACFFVQYFILMLLLWRSQNIVTPKSRYE